MVQDHGLILNIYATLPVPRPPPLGEYPYVNLKQCATAHVQTRMRASLGLGYILIVLSALFFAVGSYAILFSAFLPTPNNPVCTVSHPMQHIFHTHLLAS